MVAIDDHFAKLSAFGESCRSFLERRSDNVYLRDVHFQKYLVLNAIQAFGIDTLLYPLDVVKTRLQVQDRAKERVGDMFRMFRSLIKNEGIRGIFSGYVPAMSGGYPGHAVYYVAFEWARNYLDNSAFKKGRLERHLYLDVGISSLAGLFAEATSGLFWVPADIVSQRLQVKTLPGFINPHHQGMIDIAKGITTTEGIRGFYRGYWPSLFVYGPGSAIWWGVYEFFKDRLHFIYDFVGLRKDAYFDASIHLVSGCFGGLATSLFLNPLEVARTRFQVIEANSAVNIERIRRGFVAMLIDVARNEGVHGLYRGILPRLLVSVPGSALAIVTYEFVKRVCKVNNDDYYWPS